MVSSLTVDQGLITRIDIVLSPSKLASVELHEWDGPEFGLTDVVHHDSRESDDRDTCVGSQAGNIRPVVTFERAIWS